MVSNRMTFFLICLVLFLSLHLVAEERGITGTELVTKRDLDGKLTELEGEMWSKLVGWQLGLQAVMVVIAIFVIKQAYQAGGNKAASFVESRGTAAIETFKSDSQRQFTKYHRKISEATSIAYEGAVKSIQGFNGCMDAAIGENMTDEAQDSLKRIDIAGARLQIRFGNSNDVIAGANKLYELCETHIARRAFEEGLRRKGLSKEAKEILRDRAFELEKRRIKEDKK